MYIQNPYSRSTKSYIKSTGFDPVRLADDHYLGFDLEHQLLKNCIGSSSPLQVCLHKVSRFTLQHKLLCRIACTKCPISLCSSPRPLIVQGFSFSLISQSI
jgi:hypothetical protein